MSMHNPPHPGEFIEATYMEPFDSLGTAMRKQKNIRFRLLRHPTHFQLITGVRKHITSRNPLNTKHLKLRGCNGI